MRQPRHFLRISIRKSCTHIILVVNGICITVKYADIRGVDHVAVAFYVDCFAGVDDAFGHIGFVVEG